MKNSLFCGLFCASLLVGCIGDGRNLSAEEGVAVVMQGGLTPISPKSRGVIDPQAGTGLPPRQFDVSIITVNYATDDPTTDKPPLYYWQGQTADLTRGFFGENEAYTASAPNNNPIIPVVLRTSIIPDTGRIEYTDAGGTSVQKVFYDKGGEYYFIRIFYPFENSTFSSNTSLGAAMTFNEVDGSRDILISNLGWGNTFRPIVVTDEPDGVLIFSHGLSLFRLYVKPESMKVVTGSTDENGVPKEPGGMYGAVTDARIRFQPGTLIADAMNGNIAQVTGAPLVDYPANNFPLTTPYLTGTQSDPNDNETFKPDRVFIGYVMVLPGQSKFRMEVYTEKHWWIYGDLIFGNPTPQAGKVYDITMTIMEAYEMEIIAVESDDWYMEYIFN